jgi:hypothetical protein
VAAKREQTRAHCLKLIKTATIRHGAKMAFVRKKQFSGVRKRSGGERDVGNFTLGRWLKVVSGGGRTLAGADGIYLHMEPDAD